jgi:2'-5' RNA ligase
MRAFIAVELPEVARVALARIQHALAESRADVKWVELDNLHLTMRFLGEVSEAQGEPIRQLVERLAAGSPTVTMSLREFGAFPSAGSPRVVWVGVEQGREALTHLADQLEHGCRALGFPAEERPFAAHITLGRVRSPRGRRELSESLARLTWEAPPPWDARALTLFESVLSSSGPRYTPIVQAPFAASV